MSTNRTGDSRVKRWAILLCFFLVGVAMVAQAIHVHPTELAGSAKHCATCQIAHAPARPVASVRIAVIFTPALFLLHAPDPDDPQAPDLFALFSRPPPSSI